jgi:hypothetical protein
VDLDASDSSSVSGEAALIRKTAQNPSFSLEPTLYTIGGTFHYLLLINTGQNATNINVDCLWNEESKFFILSLSNQGRAVLTDVPIAKIVEEGKLSIVIICKYANNKNFSTRFNLDFSK